MLIDAYEFLDFKEDWDLVDEFILKFFGLTLDGCKTVAVYFVRRNSFDVDTTALGILRTGDEEFLDC